MKTLSLPSPWQIKPILPLSPHERFFLEGVALFIAHRWQKRQSEIVSLILQHKELWKQLFRLFERKFHPHTGSLNLFREEAFLFSSTLKSVPEQNTRSLFQEALLFLSHTLKTNLYVPHISALCWRLDPSYLATWTESKDKPFAIFFLHGPNFVGYHVRFRDLSRGGLRTLCPESWEEKEQMEHSLFSETYSLARTQQKKNKDIPEGGSKGVLLLFPPNPEERRSPSSWIHPAQQAFIQALVQTVNFAPDGQLLSPDIVDYWGRPEYLFLGPDEHLDEMMIEWIANFSIHSQYALKDAFISSKAHAGINHKEYGVTSLGVHVYVCAWLRFIKIYSSELNLQHFTRRRPEFEAGLADGEAASLKVSGLPMPLHFADSAQMSIDFQKEIFSVKMAGGPDGDVAGNALRYLGEDFPKTAKIVAIRDVSGLLLEPEGADWPAILELCAKSIPIAYYPESLLSSKGILVKKNSHLLYQRKEAGELVIRPLSPEETMHFLQTALHGAKADLFLPAGGRPNTLNEENLHEFLDAEGFPTSKGIVEGANLYLSDAARYLLEQKGVLIFKDSSANKGGVICSSFEVFCNLCLDPPLFMAHKPALVVDIRKQIIDLTQKEASLLLRSHVDTGRSLAVLSDELAEMMHACSDRVLDQLESRPCSPQLNQMFLAFCPSTLSTHFADRLLKNIPDLYKKAFVSCHIAAELLYKQPSIQPAKLPALLQEALSKIST